MDDFTRVRDAVDLVEVVSRYVELRRAGARMVGCCPFHAEKTPSFGIPIGQGYFKCFGCGKGGDVFTFLSEHLRISRGEALQQLAEEKGIVLERAAPAADREEFDAILRALEAAQELYRRAWASPIGAAARELIGSRGLRDAASDAFGLGYAPVADGDPWRSAVIAGRLLRAGHKREHVVAAGLAKVHDGSGDLVDELRDRVTIPIRDERGRVIAFGGRRLRDEPGSREPKYVNSRETKAFSKGRVLFGIDRARPAILRAGSAVLVEGYLDVIFAHQAGLENAVGVLGTAVTEENARRLARLAHSVTLVLDSDDAGRRAAARAVPLLVAASVDTRVLVLRDDKDPGDYFARGATHAEFAALAERDARPALDFLIEHAGGRRTLTVEERIRVAREIGQEFAGRGDPLVRRGVIEHLSRALDLPAEGLDRTLRSAAVRRPPRVDPEPGADPAQPGASSAGEAKVLPDRGVGESLPDAQVLAEEEVLIAMLEEPALRRVAAAPGSPLRFGESARARLFRMLVAEPVHERGAVVEALLGKLAEDVEAQQTLTDLVSRPVSADPAGLFDGAYRWFEKRQLREQGEQIKQRHRAALASGDPAAQARFLREFDDFRRGGAGTQPVE